MKALLIKCNLWGYASGRIEKPSDGAVAIQEWETKDEKAFAEIILAVSETEKKHLKKCTTSKDAWTKLRNIFQSSGPARKALLLQKLVSHKMKEGEDLKVHLDDFMSTVDKLSEISIEINEELLSILLLNTLPPSFEMFRRAITSRDDILKPGILKIKILEDLESTKSYESTESEDTSVMFAARDNSDRWRHHQSQNWSSTHQGNARTNRKSEK